MKAKLLFTALFLLPVLAAAQVIPVKTELKNVKVYLSGAELFHTAKAKLEKGESQILFENVASNFDLNSVSVTGKGNFVITSIGQQYDYLKNSVKPTEIKVLEDSLEILQTEQQKKQNARSLLTAEEDIILKNGNLSGRQTNVTVTEVQKYIEFVKTRVKAVKDEILTVDKDLEKLRKRSERIRKQLAELNNKYSQPVNQITINVSADTPTNAEFELSYLVYSASWTPEYTVRVEDINKPIKMSYTAKVTQNSGLEWTNVKISLSSRNPNLSQIKPELYPWNIDFQKFMKKALSKEALDSGVMMRAQAAANAPKEEMAAGSVADFTTVNENILSFDFESSIPYTIPSDSKPHSVALKDYELNGIYEFYAAPKLEKDAFLVAYITKWNDYNFLPGEASTYFQNSFMGKTYIDPNISKDTLTLSLGRDRGINVERKPLKDYTEDKFLSNDIERTFAYDIIIKNNKKKSAKLVVEEQLPLSRNEDITVKAIELSGGTLDKETGKVKWDVTVDAGKSVTKKFVFSVRYPKDKPVMGL